MIKPGDPRIKKHTEFMEKYYRENPSNWKDGLTQEEINELAEDMDEPEAIKPTKANPTNDPLVQWLIDSEQIKS